MLVAIRLFDPNIRYYQASSSEIFGHVLGGPKNEESTQYPSNPYAISKAFAHQLTIAYREHYDMFACSGILFNHESPKRGVDYVSRHVTRGVAAIKLGLEEQLSIGNLHARRDWGDARDYVRAMWLMLQQDQPGDYVIGISGSGNSENVIRAIDYGNEHGAITVGFTGYSGGRLKKRAQHNIHININDMQVAEDLHMVLNHIMMRVLKKHLM